MSAMWRSRPFHLDVETYRSWQHAQISQNPRMCQRCRCSFMQHPHPRSEGPLRIAQADHFSFFGFNSYAGQGFGKLLNLYQTPKNTCTGCRVCLMHVYESSSKHRIVRSSHNILLRCLSSILVLVDAALDLVQAVSHLQQ